MKGIEGKRERTTPNYPFEKGVTKSAEERLSDAGGRARRWERGKSRQEREDTWRGLTISRRKNLGAITKQYIVVVQKEGGRGAGRK